MKYLFFIFLFIFQFESWAGCVYGAKDCTQFKVLDYNTIVFSGGYGDDIFVKTYCYVYSNSEITILKDDFCSYDDKVLYIDGELCDVNEVEFI